MCGKYSDVAFGEIPRKIKIEKAQNSFEICSGSLSSMNSKEIACAAASAAANIEL